MIWWVICENQLRIGFRNEFLTFTSENEVDLDELHILKITFKNGLVIGMGNFPQDFSHNFTQDFPHNFPQNFPQDFCKISHRISCRISCKISHKISCKIFPQDFPTRFSHKNFPQDFPTRFSCNIFLSWILIGWLPITLFQMLNFHQSLLC